MNDFTKEELIEIYNHMENESLELLSKVKFIIDNYCEHQWITFMIDDSQSNFIDRCIYCSKLRFSPDFIDKK